MIDLTNMPPPDWVSDCGDVVLLLGDWVDRLRGLPDGCVHCVVTSPPYSPVSKKQAHIHALRSARSWGRGRPTYG